MKRAIGILKGFSSEGANAAVELEHGDEISENAASIIAFGRSIGAVINRNGGEVIIMQLDGESTSDQIAISVASLITSSTEPDLQLYRGEG